MKLLSFFVNGNSALFGILRKKKIKSDAARIERASPSWEGALPLKLNIHAKKLLVNAVPF